MFGALRPQPPDGIIAVLRAFADDPRPGKIDLGVGVYKDATGATPVMRAVKEAERQMWAAQTTKTYTAMAGDPGFLVAMTALILGATFPPGLAAIATPGGTGALRCAFDLFRMAGAGVVWVPVPTWPNHLSMLQASGLRVAPYRYFDAQTQAVDAAGMLDDLGRVAPGDVVLLHGCCHNPTGADPDAEEWARLAGLLQDRGGVPLIDLAYQGFGAGLDADAGPTRLLTGLLPEAVIAASCSKTFGIYRERTGILIAKGADAGLLQANLTLLNRLTYSFPPDHGARLVTTVLTDPALRADWEAELNAMRTGMQTLRAALADELRRITGSDRWGFLARHRGMFSRIGATPDQVERLRADHGIYMIGDSRINVAGLSAATVPVVARAIAEELR